MSLSPVSLRRPGEIGGGGRRQRHGPLRRPPGRRRDASIRRSIQQNDARPGVQIAELRARPRGRAGPGTDGSAITQQSVGTDADVAARATSRRRSSRTRTIVGSYDTIDVVAHRGAFRGVELGRSRAGSSTSASGLGADVAGRGRASTGRSCRRSVAIRRRRTVTAAAAAADRAAAGTPGRRRQPPITSHRRLRRAWSARGPAGQARRCRRHPARQRPAGRRRAPVPRLPPHPRPVPAQWLHGDIGQLRPLVPTRSSRAERRWTRWTREADVVGPGSGGVVALPYMLGEKTPHQRPGRDAVHSWA